VVFAALCRRGCPGERRLLRSLPPTSVHLQPKLTKGLAARIATHAPDLLVSWYWTQRIAPEILALAPAFGVHPSLLPRHRGADPIFWAIDAGDAVTGVTAHRLEAEYDTGELLATEELAITAECTGWSLAKRLDRPSLRTLRAVCTDFAVHRTLAGRVQDARIATHAPALRDDELEIDWTWTSARIERRVRAASPYPGAFAYIGDELVVITRAAVEPLRGYAAMRPGELLLTDSVARIRTADGILCVLGARLVDAETDAESTLDAKQLCAHLEQAAAVLPFR
jgi:methionyl-tRNA formyltransferase